MYQESPGGCPGYPGFSVLNPSTDEEQGVDDGSYELNPPIRRGSYGGGYFLVFLGIFAMFGVASMTGMDNNFKELLRSNNIIVASTENSEWDDDVKSNIVHASITSPSSNSNSGNSWDPVESNSISSIDDAEDDDPTTDINSNNIISTTRDLNLLFSASNEYGIFSAPYPWLKDTIGAQLIEPYKTTTLTLSDTTLLSSSYRVVWEIPSLGISLSGNPTMFVVNSTGVFDITISVYDASTDSFIDSLSTILISKYVKRELRSLTIADRERFLDAAAVLWQLGDIEGRAKYGSQYTSVATFVVEHAQASGDIQCDQFHEGSGFLTHHLALTNSFDAALRAVDPSVTLPYWDFTIEGQQIKDASGLPSMFLDISPFLSDTWFGSVDSSGKVIDSRWKNMRTATISDVSDDQEFTVLPNSYGYVRSYWNNNNEDTVKRILFSVCGMEPSNKHVPTCKDHYDVLNTETLGDFQTLSPSDGHGPMHVFFGGVGGDCATARESFISRWSSVLNADITDEEIKQAGLTAWTYDREAARLSMLERDVYGEYFHIWRSLWRSHMCARDDTPSLLECPESCDVDVTPLEDCSCKVNALIDGRTDWENVYYCVLSPQNRAVFDKLMPAELLEDLVTTIATTSTIEGEMMESGSPSDIFLGDTSCH